MKKKKVKNNLKCEKKNIKEKKTKKKKVIIELNIISSLELKKYLKSFLFIWLFFLFSQILFYTHKDL